MANGDRRLSDGRVLIQVSLGDAYHVSGGPFCCFLRVAPIASNWSDADERVTIDFISCNVYGLVTFHDRVADLSHIQGTYQFGFLKDVRAGLKPNESCHLLFTSDAVIFSTSTEIGPSTPECYYRYMCTIPPFLPPTVNSDHVSCNYYVYVNVQYSNGIGSSQRSTLQCRLEFSIQGSIYSDVPTLNNEAYPFLPKSEGYILEGGRIDDRLLPKLYAEVKNGNLGNGSMLFDYDTLIDYLDPSLGDSTLVAKSSPNRYLLFRDLNAYWHVWDTMHGSNFVHEPEESYILRRYNGFVDEFTKMILNGPSKERLEQLRPWFGDMLSPWYTEDSELLDEDARAKLLEQFYKDLEERHTKFYGISLDNLRRAASESVEVKRENPLQGMLVFKI
uniref:Uncharacterized protein n=1 Tax=Babesia bovis TaxID=5865 RepID=A7AQN4_BABBO|eukprot:XP_001610421.1 hypothetical protein [Babesia bovis T2Bo]